MSVEGVQPTIDSQDGIQVSIQSQVGEGKKKVVFMGHGTIGDLQVTRSLEGWHASKMVVSKSVKIKHRKIHTYIHTYTHKYIDRYIHKYVHTYVHTYIPPHTHTHTHPLAPV